MRKTHIPIQTPSKTYYFRVISEAVLQYDMGYRKLYLLEDENDPGYIRVASYISHLGMWYFDTMSVETYINKKFRADLERLRAQMYAEMEPRVANMPNVVEVRPHVYERRA